MIISMNFYIVALASILFNEVNEILMEFETV